MSSIKRMTAMIGSIIFRLHAMAWASVIILMLTFVACSSDDPKPTEVEPPIEEPLPEEPSDPEGNFNRLIRVENFAGDTLNGLETTARLYYSLEENRARPDTYAKTALWDLAFANIFNSYLSGNYGREANNHGSGSAGVGGIYMVYTPFEEVTDVPADNLFVTRRDVYGPDDFWGSGPGWYFYDFGGELFPDNPDKRHVAYPLFDRTVIVRTANGHYAKLKIISIYKDAPEDPTKDSPAPFYTFEYVLVPKGSTKFEIKTNE